MNLEKLTNEEIKERKNALESEEERRKAQEKLDWHRSQIKEICNNKFHRENICEWCGANHTRGEECDDQAHYLNR